VRRKSGKYKIVDPDHENSEYEVYCHFDSDGVWTLVQSYSFANGSYGSKFPNFRKPMSEDRQVGENAVTWSGYRLSKSRMRSIKDDSTFVQFTCDYEKVKLDIKKSDYLQISLQRNINTNNQNRDILTFSGFTSEILVGKGHGAIGGYDLTDCKIKLHQKDWYSKLPLHVHVMQIRGNCEFDSSCVRTSYDYFGSFVSSYGCLEKEHRCVQKDNSTTQVWFGTRNAR
jgi:hypothetical protein